MSGLSHQDEDALVKAVLQRVLRHRQRHALAPLGGGSDAAGIDSGEAGR